MFGCVYLTLEIRRQPLICNQYNEKISIFKDHIHTLTHIYISITPTDKMKKIKGMTFHPFPFQGTVGTCVCVCVFVRRISFQICAAYARVH